MNKPTIIVQFLMSVIVFTSCEKELKDNNQLSEDLLKIEKYVGFDNGKEITLHYKLPAVNGEYIKQKVKLLMVKKDSIVISWEDIISVIPKDHIHKEDKNNLWGD